MPDCVVVLVSDSTTRLEEELHTQLRSSDLLKDQTFVKLVLWWIQPLN